jgi:asparagine synthase (glutamine-hydrolysing)
MCGILGWYGGKSPEDSIRFGKALDTLSHRGPDDSGIFEADGIMLGHRRLSILDLSPGGRQPMIDPVRGSIIVFNGEIYNYLELRTELVNKGHRFFGNSDTEVLLHALNEWDVSALSRLNGMWAFAFWQPDRRRLLLSRDRFGVKPLYYRQGDEGFAFASEPKALLELFPGHRAVSEPALLDFLANNLLFARGESFYKGIRVLPPAHFGEFDYRTGGFKMSRYWDYPESADGSLTVDDALEQFDELFSDAVRLRLRSDVPVGMTLSGGLDSTGVLTAASSFTSATLTSFTSIYSERETGELPWAQLASDAVKSRLIPVTAPDDQWLETLGQIARHMDGPGYSPAVYPLWHLMKRARTEGIPVLLEGQGADEALAGYPQYAVLEMIAYVTGKAGIRRSVAGMKSRIAALNRTFSLPWVLAWTAREVSPAMLRWHRHRVGFHSLMRSGLQLPVCSTQSVSKEVDPVRTRLLADHSLLILPGLLHYGDAISMAFGIESRLPFMDYRLVEWMFRLPASLMFHGNETKWVLREYLRKHGQVKIGNRPDKKGYPTPAGQWLATEQGLKVERMLLADNNPLHQWCDPVKIRSLIERNRQGAMAADHHLYKLLSTHLWISECIDRRGAA